MENILRIFRLNEKLIKAINYVDCEESNVIYF